jgi:antitoxin component of MazEF toxin-antitoxin module
MPLIRRVYNFGNEAIGVTLPKSWFDEIERRTGKKIQEVLMSVNEKIVIEPYIPPKEEQPKKEKAKQVEEVF